MVLGAVCEKDAVIAAISNGLAVGKENIPSLQQDEVTLAVTGVGLACRKLQYAEGHVRGA